MSPLLIAALCIIAYLAFAVYARKRQIAWANAQPAPQSEDDTLAREALTAKHLSVTERIAMHSTLRSIRNLPEALGENEHQNGRYL